MKLLYFASAENTVLAKLEWYQQGGGVSDRQWSDLLGVLKVQSSALDRAYLDHWAEELGVADLLQRALVEAGLIPGNCSLLPNVRAFTVHEVDSNWSLTPTPCLRSLGFLMWVCNWPTQCATAISRNES